MQYSVFHAVFEPLSLRAEQHWFWRQSTEDAVYSAPGTVLRPGTGSDEAYVGAETDLLLNWQIDRHLSAYLGYSHFFPGDFIRAGRRRLICLFARRKRGRTFGG